MTVSFWVTSISGAGVMFCRRPAESDWAQAHDSMDLGGLQVTSLRKIHRHMGNYGKMWENIGKYGKIWEHMGKSGNIQMYIIHWCNVYIVHRCVVWDMDGHGSKQMGWVVGGFSYSANTSLDWSILREEWCCTTAVWLKKLGQVVSGDLTPSVTKKITGGSAEDRLLNLTIVPCSPELTQCR